MKNYEIPANEINALGPFLPYFSPEDFEAGDMSEIFPATFQITKIAVEAYFTEKGVDLATVKLFNSEADSDDIKTPQLSAIMSAQWGFSEDENGEDIEAPFNENPFFEYGWRDNYQRWYELTINNKPALLIDGSDGTSGTNFSWIEIIFPA